MSKVLMECTTRSLKKITASVPVGIAKAVVENHEKRGFFFVINEQEMFSIDMRNIMQIQVRPEEATDNPDTVEPVKAKIIPPPAVRRCWPQTEFKVQPLSEVMNKPVENVPDTKANVDDEQPKVKDLFKIECRCGANYFATLFSDSKKARCRECQAPVFVDRYAPQRTGDNGRSATLVTNKYRVPFVDESAEDGEV